MPFHQGALVSGSLMSQAGQGDRRRDDLACRPRPKAPLRASSHWPSLSPTPQGHFTYQVPPGPNRQILLGYRHDAFQIARAIRYRAHVKPTLRLSRHRVGKAQADDPHPRILARRSRGRTSGGSAGERPALKALVHLPPCDHRLRRRLSRPLPLRRHDPRPPPTGSAPWCPRQHGYPWEVGHSTPKLVKVRGS